MKSPGLRIVASNRLSWGSPLTTTLVRQNGGWASSLTMADKGGWRAALAAADHLVINVRLGKTQCTARIEGHGLGEAAIGDLVGIGFRRRSGDRDHHVLVAGWVTGQAAAAQS